MILYTKLPVMSTNRGSNSFTEYNFHDKIHVKEIVIMKKKKSSFIKIAALILIIIYMFLPSSADRPGNTDIPSGNNTSVTDLNNTGNDTHADTLLDEDGYYYSKEDVALYLSQYGKLPDNYITKSEAYDLGWDSDEGNLWEVADGMVIGGDKFGNREKILPIKDGVQYYECDVNYNGGYRDAQRIVYSSDGNIYYTDDHYESFSHIGTFEVKK